MFRGRRGRSGSRRAVTCWIMRFFFLFTGKIASSLLSEEEEEEEEEEKEHLP